MRHELHKNTATIELLWSEYQQGVAARGGELKSYQYSQRFPGHPGLASLALGAAAKTRLR